MKVKQAFFGALLTALAEPQIRAGLIDAGRAGLQKLSRWLDTDGDGDIDGYDIEKIMSFLSAYASLLGQMAAADGVVVEDEEVEAAEVFEAVVFSDEGLLPPPVLQALDLTKAEMKCELMRQFSDPLPVKRIVEFAKENGLEESFYQDACLMARADKAVADDERDFLSEFAEMLNVNRIDRIRIERRYLAEGTD